VPNNPLPAAAATPGRLEFYKSQYEEHTEHGRHLETERSAVTTIVIAGQAAVFTFIGTKDFKPDQWMVSWVIVFLGLFGLAVCSLLNTKIKRAHSYFGGYRHAIEDHLFGPSGSPDRVALTKFRSEMDSHRFGNSTLIGYLWLAIHVVMIGCGLWLTLFLHSKLGTSEQPKQSACPVAPISIQNSPVINVEVSSRKPIAHQAPQKPAGYCCGKNAATESPAAAATK